MAGEVHRVRRGTVEDKVTKAKLGKRTPLTTASALTFTDWGKERH